MNWVDFTRRSDPAHPKGVARLEQQLQKYGIPRVLCFWTKAPNVVATLYHDIINDISKQCLVLAQVTLNTYDREMEPGITPDMTVLKGLIELLGGPGHVRLRFDPIIPGYTQIGHFMNCLDIAHIAGISQITTNFLVPSYKGVGKLLKEKGFSVFDPTVEWKKDVLTRMVAEARERDIVIAGCAELYRDNILVDGMRTSGCADPSWAIGLRPELDGIFTQRASRPGCLCVYDADWGQYASRGGYRCPHNCLYCYAK